MKTYEKEYADENKLKIKGKALHENTWFWISGASDKCLVVIFGQLTKQKKIDLNFISVWVKI